MLGNAILRPIRSTRSSPGWRQRWRYTVMTVDRERLLTRVAELDIDWVEVEPPGGPLRVQRHLTTNAQLCRVINDADLESWRWGGYECVNDFNDDQPIRRNWLTRQLEVDARYAHHPAIGVSWIGAAAFARAVGGRL